MKDKKKIEGWESPRNIAQKIWKRQLWGPRGS